MAEDQNPDTDRAARLPAFEQLAPQTVSRFPHIIARLQAVWGDPSEGQTYLNSLLVDERGNRQGFPMSVLMELMELNELFQRQGGEDKEADSWSSHESVL